MAGRKHKIMSNKEFRQLKAKSVQFVEGVKKSLDEVNALLRSGYRTPPFTEGLRYTFTPKEKRNLGLLGAGAAGFGIVSWKLAKLAKRTLDNRNKENL